jgi:putative endonuclease
MERKKLGDKGEEIAASFLRSKGYSIREMKWRQSRYEIDLIASKDNSLIFVEVKTLRNTLLGPPELRVTKSKQKRIAIAAGEYLAQIGEEPAEIRFDVIAIIWQKDKSPAINHIESAFILD